MHNEMRRLRADAIGLGQIPDRRWLLAIGVQVRLDEVSLGCDRNCCIGMKLAGAFRRWRSANAQTSACAGSRAGTILSICLVKVGDVVDEATKDVLAKRLVE